MVGASVEFFGVVRTKKYRVIPVEAVLHHFCARTCGQIGIHVGRALLARFQVLHGHVAFVVTAINHFTIQWVGGQVGAFANGQGGPVFFGNCVTVAAVRDAHAGVVLLRPVDAVGEMIVGGYAVKLGGGLVVVGRPVVATIVGYLGAAIVGHDHPAVVVGVNPEVVVVAMGGIFEGKSAATVFGNAITHVQHVHDVFILGVGINAAIVPGALQQGAILVDPSPGFASILGAVHATFLVFDDGPNSIGILGRNRHPNDAIDAAGHARFIGKVFPSIAAIGAFPEFGIRAAAVHAVPIAGHVPGTGVDDARVIGVEDEVGSARLIVNVEDFFPALAPVHAAEYAAHFVGFPEVAQSSYVQHVGVFGVDPNAGNVPGILQANAFPGRPCIGGFPKPSSGSDVVAQGLFAFPYVDDVGVALRHGHRTNGTAKVFVADVVPGLACILGAPDSPTNGTEVVQIGITAYASSSAGTPTAEGAELTPAEAFVKRGVKSEGLVGLGKAQDAEYQHHAKGENGFLHLVRLVFVSGD